MVPIFTPIEREVHVIIQQNKPVTYPCSNESSQQSITMNESMHFYVQGQSSVQIQNPSGVN